MLTPAGLVCLKLAAQCNPVTSVISFEGEGEWVEYAGGYSDMVNQKNKSSNIKKQLIKI